MTLPDSGSFYTNRHLCLQVPTVQVIQYICSELILLVLTSFIYRCSIEVLYSTPSDYSLIFESSDSQLPLVLHALMLARTGCFYSTDKDSANLMVVMIVIVV